MNGYEISTYVAGGTLFIQRNEIGHRALRKPIASCSHDRFCEAIGESVLRHLETGVTGRLVDAVNGHKPTRRRMTVAERTRTEEHLKELLTSEQQLAEFIAKATDHTRAGLEGVLKNTQKRIANLRSDLDADAQPDTPVEPYTQVDVANLFRGLADIMNSGSTSDDLRELLALRVVRIEPLRITFEAHLRLPAEAAHDVELGPIPFSVESTTRLPAGLRATAMAELCFDRAWPASVIAPGVPLLCAGYAREKIANAISRILKPRIGGKAAGMVAGSEVPEVIGVISRHLGLGKPEIEIAPDLEKRIIETYVNGQPRGPKGWPQFSDQHRLSSVFRQVHAEGAASAVGISSKEYWCREGWLRREGRRFIRQTCLWCESADLAVFAVPEVKGLVCLECRKDRTGLAFSASWNSSIVDPGYWRQEGWTLEVPRPSDFPSYVFEVEPMLLR